MPAASSRNTTPSTKTLRRWKVVAFLSVMFFCGFTWYSHSFKDLILQGMCNCANNNTNDISPNLRELDSLQDTHLPSTNDISPNLRELDSLQDTHLPRMIYAKSNTLNQTRTDVLTMSPWFAPIVWEGTYNRDILDEQFKMRNVRIGLTVFAIKKYVIFIQHFIETAEKFFMVGHKVNIYIFTDQPDKVPNITLAAGRQIITLQVPAYKRWQDVTMRRMEMLHNASRDIFVHEVDYIVAVDMDEEFLNTVGVEILSDLVGTLHPGFYTKKRHQFTYDRNPKCQAYIPVDEGDFYYAGGFFCGTVNEVYKLTGYCHEAMMIDREHGIEALWHDESHLNKYLLYHKPTKILSPEYLYDNYVGAPVVRMPLRFKAVPKNPSALRNK